MRTLNILIVSRSRPTAETLAGHFAGSREYIVQTRVLTNGHADPLYGINQLPDILLLHCVNGQSELRFLADNGVRDQLPLIVCGPAADTEAMRLGMRAGARDYLPENMAAADLLASVARIKDETSRSRDGNKGKLIVVANGKGGSGASFISTNLAHSLVVDGGHSVLLTDLDLQFGGLCRYLDIEPEVGIIEALEAVSEMDEVSAEAYTCEHASGLKLMAATSKRATLPRAISIERLESLLNVYLSLYDFVITDVPAHLDPVNELFFEKADQVLIVVQQFLPNVQNASRLIRLLTSEVGVQNDRIAVVVNRFAKNADIEISDIQRALRVNRITSVPNQFKLASESINSGVPVAELSRNAPLTKGIRKLQTALADPVAATETGLLQRALPNFLRR